MKAGYIAVALLVSAGLVSTFAGGTGRYCVPGDEWHEVRSGEITREGWSVVNFSKPEGGEMKVRWTFENFDGGPAAAGAWFGFGPEDMAAGATLHTSRHAEKVRVQSDAADDRSVEVSTGHINSTGSSTLNFRILFPPAFEDEDLHIFQYAAGEGPPDRKVTWTLYADSCLPDPQPPAGVASGGEATLVSTDDMEGTLSARADVYAPLMPFDGAAALVDASATTEATDVPYIETYWGNDAGEIEMEGPQQLTEDDLTCLDWGDDTHCFSWGAYAGYIDDNVSLLPGTYRYDVNGFTDPTQEADRFDGSTVGPHIVAVSTRLPSWTDGGDGT